MKNKENQKGDANDVVNNLLKEIETTDNQVLKNALKKQLEDEQKIAETKLLSVFKSVKRLLDYQVEELRKIRKDEDVVKTIVVKINNEYETLKKTGNVEECIAAINKIHGCRVL
jgi:ERCC4-type nuclease